MRKLTVIYYHDIVENGKGYSYQRVEEQAFEMQMKYLSEHGYTSLLFEELDGPLPEKAVLVTFDDGFRTVFDRAAPIMRKYGIKGNVFVPTKYVEEENPHFMTWHMMKELCDAGDFSVAAHTHSHVDIRALDDAKMRSELQLSNDLIRDRLGITTKSFCMPYGKYDFQSVRRLKKNSDYELLFGSFYGQAICGKSEKKILPRIGISNDDSMGVFEKKLSGKLNWKGLVQRCRLFAANMKRERITQYDIV